MSKSWSKKHIEISLSLGDGRGKTIRGLACEVEISKDGLPDKNKANISIWGMIYDDMASLTTLAWKPYESMRNRITVSAGSDEESLSVIYKGEITSAYADFNQSPDVCFKIEAMTGYYPQQISDPPLSINGEAGASEIVQQLAKKVGYAFESGGDVGSLKNAIFHGSPIKKASDIADQVGADLLVDDDTLILQPRGQARQGSAVFLSKDTGLIGYPTFSSNGISCSCFFNNNLQHWGQVEIDSIVPKASGTWFITKLSHKLTAYKAGPWESQIEAIDYV